MKGSFAFSFCAVLLALLLPLPADAQIQRPASPLPGTIQPRTTVPPDVIRPTPPTVQFAPALIYGDCSVGTIKISAPSPAAGTKITVTTKSPFVSLGTYNPVSTALAVTVPAGKQTAPFNACTIRFPQPGETPTAVIYADQGGIKGQGALTISPVKLVSVSVPVRQVMGGNTLKGTVTISGPFGPYEQFNTGPERVIKFTPSDPTAVTGIGVAQTTPPTAKYVSVDPKGYSHGLAPAQGIVTVQFDIKTAAVKTSKVVTIVIQLGSSQLKTDVTVVAPKP